MKNKLLLMLMVLYTISSSAQIGETIAQLPEIKLDQDDLVADLTRQQKIERLTLLPNGDSLQFQRGDYEPDGPKDQFRYWPLSFEGIRFIDLNADGELDLLYSGQSGNMSTQSTKVLIFQEGKYVQRTILRGTVIHIGKGNTGEIEVFTYTPACCGTISSRIDQHLFLLEKLERGPSILLPGRLVKPKASEVAVKKGDDTGTIMKDFSKLKRAKLSQLKLSIFQADKVPGVHISNKERRTAFRAGEPELLVALVGSEVKVGIIGNKVYNDEQWYLVITDPIDKVSEHRYGWGNKSSNVRLIAWTKDLEFE